MADQNLEKHTSRNPIQRFFIRRFFNQIKVLFETIPHPETVLEAGCGEGFLIKYLKEKNELVKFTGIDLDEKAIEFARTNTSGIEFEQGSIYKLPYEDNSFNVVICSEVLEHLDRPEEGLKELMRVTKRHLILSVPHEPFFRICNFLRGRNILRLGNYPFHLQTWTKNGFVSFVQKHLEVHHTKTSFPWTLVHATKKDMTEGNQNADQER